MRKDPKEESEKCINTDQEDIKSIGGRERRVGLKKGSNDQATSLIAVQR
jgi:hypothetical protein